jgi:glucose dehydrogenase
MKIVMKIAASLLSVAIPVLAVLATGGLTIKEQETALQKLTPVTTDMLQNPQPGDWLMRRGNYAAWGYSSLAQITAGNVGHLKPAWAWNMEPGYQEEAPLAHDGVIFLANPHNVVPIQPWLLTLIRGGSSGTASFFPATTGISTTSSNRFWWT